MTEFLEYDIISLTKVQRVQRNAEPLSYISDMAAGLGCVHMGCLQW